VVAMSGGSGMSIVPEVGEAVLRPAGEAAAAFADLSLRAAAWAAAHPPAQLAVSRDGDLLKVVAHGKGGHSSTPEEAHNALTDLAGFVATLDLRRDAWGALAGFVGNVVGPTTDGAGLGLRHSDPVMGPLTASVSFLREVDGAPAAQINLRHPRGLTEEEIARRAAERVADWSRETGGTLTAETRFLSHPHLVPAEGPLVSSLLQVWEEVTGTPGRPVAIGGGTQARLFQGGVDFGPALSMDHYRGHGPDEYLTTAELRRIAELTVAAVWRLGR
jgi:acetylornithine deacetylase/succinyl-diaminopimelate desuccinylase-like protein